MFNENRLPQKWLRPQNGGEVPHIERSDLSQSLIEGQLLQVL
jgi:hypothetical protein